MNPDTQPEADEKVDLTNCDREPIHVIGSVQDFGCLVSVTTDWIINHVSQNVSRYLGVNAEDLVGDPLSKVLDNQAIHDLRTQIQLLQGADAVERVFGLELQKGSDKTFDIAIYRSGRSYVLEFQPHESALSSHHVASVRSMIARLQQADDTAGICSLSARFLKSLSGFDRVMVYRFAPDGSGEVIAEDVEPGFEPFLGLHYPASDIPKQARELYKRNLLRIISDVDSPVSPIYPPTNPEGETLDLSLSAIRAVSPIHIEYLRNMGVRASMSVSIMRRGKLWGLFACHHYSPRILSYDLRSAVELFGQMFAFALDQSESDAAADQSAKARRFHDTLMTQLAEGRSLLERFDIVAQSVADVIPCDGVALWTEGAAQKFGATPDDKQIRGLVRFLNTAGTGRVYAASAIGKVYPPGEEFAAEAAGVLAIPVSRTPRDYLLLFRREMARSVTWAGNPQKPAEYGPNGARLTPRKSFESWKEIVRGQSADWTGAETDIAEHLRVTLLEVVLRLADEAAAERGKARERQDLLIAELNHRVRNILNLIRGLIGQTRGSASSIDEFIDVIGGRIQALARAHDQVTRENWSPAALRSLIEVETEAYLGAASTRVAVEGEDVLLMPKAFTTLSLVIHELATNSVKYGALSAEGGQVRVEIAPLAKGGVVLSWREQGGPAVVEPSRRGFGSTIIERSVPYELGGKAEVRYVPTGLEADFTLPGDAIAEGGEGAPQQRPARPAEPASDRSATMPGDALIVEDNIIIAMDVETGLGDLGVKKCHIAPDTAAAMAALDDHPIGIALLDVNLGKGTSATVADRLVAEGIPFVFSTGYGDSEPLIQRHPAAPVLVKPFDHAQLRDAVMQALAAGES